MVRPKLPFGRVLLTASAFSAMNGLDDLRGEDDIYALSLLIDPTPGWTLNGNIQPFIDLFVSVATFREVQRAFPYLVSKEFASGGGDVSTSPFCNVLLLITL